MHPVVEAVMSLVVSLASASYGQFGVTLKDPPHLHRAARSEPAVVQRVSTPKLRSYTPCVDEPASRT